MIHSSTIEFDNNSFNGVHILLAGDYIKLSGNVEKKVGKVSVGSQIFNTDDAAAEQMVCSISRNLFHEFTAHGKGRLDIIGKNSIRIWGTVITDEKQSELELFLGPKLRLFYPKDQLDYLQSVRRTFLYLYKASINRDDKSQQKLIRNEISRLEYHIYKETAISLGERIDMIPRWVVYIFKLEFSDRVLMVKSILWVLALVTAFTSPIGPLEVIFGFDFWEWIACYYF